MRARRTRAAILEAAIELGSVRGLEELSIGGLAAEVKMSKSGLFAHFGSKQELQLATVTQAWEIFEAQVLDEGDDSLSGLLERWLAFYARRVFTGGCFFVIAAVELAAREDAVREALASAVEWQIAALETAVGRAQETGEVATRKESTQIAFELHSILVHADALFNVRRDPAVFERARAAIGELLGWSDVTPAVASGRDAQRRR